MAPARAFWKGYLKLSLVSCPIALYTGTSAPDGQVGQDAFAVIREAMRGKDMVALGRVVLAKRERVIMLQPWDKAPDTCSSRLPSAVLLSTRVGSNKGERGQGGFSKANAIDPVPRAVRAYERLQTWGESYSDRHQDDVMRPLVNIGAIHGGEAFKPSRSAETCSLYLNINFVRGQTVMDVERELQAELRELFADDKDARFEVNVYLAKQPHLLETGSELIIAMKAGHQNVFGAPLPEVSPARYSVSSDNPVFAQFGVQAIQYGAGGISLSGGITVNEPGVGEVLSIENLASCAKVYASAATQLLSKQP